MIITEDQDDRMEDHDAIIGLLETHLQDHFRPELKRRMSPSSVSATDKQCISSDDPDKIFHLINILNDISESSGKHYKKKRKQTHLRYSKVQSWIPLRVLIQYIQGTTDDIYSHLFNVDSLDDLKDMVHKLFTRLAPLKKRQEGTVHNSVVSEYVLFSNKILSTIESFSSPVKAAELITFMEKIKTEFHEYISYLRKSDVLGRISMADLLESQMKAIQQFEQLPAVNKITGSKT